MVSSVLQEPCGSMWAVKVSPCSSTSAGCVEVTVVLRWNVSRR
jgi:hypothetical protein